MPANSLVSVLVQVIGLMVALRDYFGIGNQIDHRRLRLPSGECDCVRESMDMRMVPVGRHNGSRDHTMSQDSARGDDGGV